MRRALLLLITVLLLVCLCGCFQQEKSEEIRLIGVLQPNLTADWQLKLKEDIDDTAAKHEELKCIYADAGNSTEKQISDIEDMIKREVDALIIFPCDEQLVSDTLKKAVQEGIYVIVLGYAPYDAQAYTLQLFINNYKVGYMAGEYACEVLKGKGAVLELQEDPASRITQERKKGFLAAINHCPNVKKEFVVVGYGTKDNASDALLKSEILEQKPRIDFVFAHNNEMAEGVSNALLGTEYEPIIIGTGNLESKDDLKHTGIDASIGYRTLGVEAVDYALKLINGQSFEKSVEFDPVLYVENNHED